MMGYSIQVGQTTQPLVFLLVDSTDNKTGKTGLSPMVTISKNGGPLDAPLGTISEIGNGWYKVAGNATDANTLGPLILHVTATDANDEDYLFHVVAFDPLIASMGLTDVGANVTQWTGNNVAATSVNGVPLVNIGYLNGEAVSNRDGVAQAGSSTTITLDATETAATDTLIGRGITIIGGTGIGQARVITGYGGTSTKVATVHRDWVVVPDNTSKYVLDSTTEITDKDGYKLAATGLDAIAITDPGSPASQTTFPKKLMGIWRSIFGKSELGADYYKMYAEDGTTVNSTQAMSDDGTTQTRGEAS